MTAAITPERIRLNRYLLFMFSTSFFFFFIFHKNSRMFPPGLSVLIILLSRIICPSWILQTGIGTFVIPPCLIPVQIGKQMLPHIFILVPDQSEAEQKGAERKCRVIPDLRLFCMGTGLVDRLCGYGKCQCDIRPDFSCMEGAFKTTPFQCSLGKNSM